MLPDHEEKPRMGHILRNEGTLRINNFLKAWIYRKKARQALGKILVNKGWISREILKKVICKQRRNLYSCLSVAKGTFEYKDAEINLKNGDYALNAMNIILEASRRIDEMSILAERISS
jgi:hypothetical protein